MSNLTQSQAELLAEIANNYGASPAVSALTDSPAEIIGAWYAATVGGSNPYLSMSTNQMLAAIRNDIVGGTAKSHLFASAGELLADLATSISGSTVSRFSSSVGEMLASFQGVETFLRDTFTDSDTTLLTGHTGEIGATWTVQSGYAPATAPTIASNALYAPAITAAYYGSGAPAVADYTVETSLVFRTSVTSDAVGPAARMQAGANTMYAARYAVALAGWQLLKFVAGSATQLGSVVSEAYPLGQTRNLAIRVLGTRIAMRLDGVDIAVTTDADISAAGRAGFRCGAAVHSTTAGIHIDRIAARYS